MTRKGANWSPNQTMSCTLPDRPRLTEFGHSRRARRDTPYCARSFPHISSVGTSVLFEDENLLRLEDQKILVLQESVFSG